MVKKIQDYKKGDLVEITYKPPLNDSPVTFIGYISKAIDETPNKIYLTNINPDCKLRVAKPRRIENVFEFGKVKIRPLKRTGKTEDYFEQAMLEINFRGRRVQELIKHVHRCIMSSEYKLTLVGYFVKKERYAGSEQLIFSNIKPDSINDYSNKQIQGLKCREIKNRIRLGDIIDAIVLERV